MADLLLRLVDAAGWRSVLSMSPKALIDGFESGALRGERPEQDPRLESSFDSDLAGELLEWFDASDGLLDDAASPSDGHDMLSRLRAAAEDGRMSRPEAAEPLRLLADWASPGTWRVWEGRGLLYIEPLLDGDLAHAGELYRAEVWQRVGEVLAGQDESGYAEGVVLDWMQRRSDLGETLDDSEDPRIIPTMSAHDRAARTLHHAMERRRREGFVAFVGQEWAPADRWGQAEWNLGRIIDNGWPEVT